MHTFLKIAGTVVVAGSLISGALAADMMLQEKRTEAMKSNGKNFGAIGKVVKGEMAYSPELVDNAEAIHQTSMMLKELFKGGETGDPKSRAKPEIWSDWNDFEAKIEELQETSEKLVAATKTGDVEQITVAAKAAGGACGGCHKLYRTEKKS
jgi:cytochrome c556